ncbi:hypothetical protein CES85_1607 [Ochrobactrum quorumnocens]|uniref:Uncharacterized protein n=1 Tax=Ochrobactrum quorumnocens TaxID=271865 RepID=A0A248UHB6_9HYPH|nr:hypothetical protein CES85_1607 [[Ochrobactrum] quorumnocens]
MCRIKVVLTLFSQRRLLDRLFPLSSESTAFPVISMACLFIRFCSDWLPLS